MSETLESLRASFNRSLRVAGKADRTLVLYGQSITYFSQCLIEQSLPVDLSSLTRSNVLGWLDAHASAWTDPRHDPHALARAAPVR